MSKTRKLIESGEWNDGISWKIYQDTELPDPALCSAVACVAIHDQEKETVVLTQNERGWEILAGHIDPLDIENDPDGPRETVEQALQREAIEEGGFIIASAFQFGYREVTATERPTGTDRRSRYAYPVSYIPYYYGFGVHDPALANGKEIVSCGVFGMDEIEELVASGQMKPVERTLIRMGILAAKEAWAAK